MKEYTIRLSDRNAKILEQLVKDGILKSPEAVLENAVSGYLRDSIPQAGFFAIDPHPADNGAHKTQNPWIDFFNGLERIMISAADVYGARKNASSRARHNLRSDLYASLLVTSTRISYDDDLSGRVTQNYGSKVVKPSQAYVPVIPVYNGTPLARALQTEEGVNYLQALFGTSDDSKTIIKTLERLSGKRAEDIKLRTPDKESRKRYPERAVVFDVDK